MIKFNEPFMYNTLEALQYRVKLTKTSPSVDYQKDSVPSTKGVPNDALRTPNRFFDTCVC